MKPGMTRWNDDPLYSKPFSPVHRALEFLEVLWTSIYRTISRQLAALWPMATSKKTLAL
jgi:hypothetical protein